MKLKFPWVPCISLAILIEGAYQRACHVVRVSGNDTDKGDDDFNVF